DGDNPYGTSTTGKFLEKTTKAGSYPANAWGLYDMHGNVGEWCSDWYSDYPSGSVTDPVGTSSGRGRVGRGGHWCADAVECRSAHRAAYAPGNRGCYLGLRVSLVSGDK
ncbi:MAG: SUMF1/EgtB/PvdO family nonheme iron enzyme, partial [Planctomycetaceae bacterium]|nr:SUMF1/EgtB/PvdO family nonheme iron enzyme [Planctomycetaceae bacterium]